MKHLLAALLLALSSLPGLAAEVTPPDELVRNAVTNVLSALEARKGKLAEDPGFIRGQIEQHVLPSIDLTAMSRLVLGKYWREATPEQQTAFNDGFRELLIRTYSKPLSAYEGQRVEFLPYRPDSKPDLATVKSQIVPPDGPPIPVHYRLRKQAGSPWMVYDFTIDGISMITSYRADFSGKISRAGLAEFLSTFTASYKVD